MPSSGSRMGAAAIWQMRPDAVIVALSMPLTCGNVVELRFRRLERSLRGEEAAGSSRHPDPGQRPLPLAGCGRVLYGVVSLAMKGRR